MRDFYSRVYKVVSKIPKGRVTTYKIVAQLLLAML
jgi:alkylated DNA nucleotide flippase Atl1